ncbi:T9SS type A sorting domain-containing protein, partial [Gilvimarinus agarilyticus]|nr:T9SS type A sorting domain-containing protein [Gilvimarinus agarilyticus]
ETGTAYTVTATDANTITYSLGSGNDEALFDIVGSTGVVTFKAAPDFESPADTDEDNAYLINVIASDGTNTVNQNVTITVTDVDDTYPVFTSATTASFIENETGTAYTVTATDANTITYSLGSGNDEALFDIVGSTGVVTFKTAPNFESPADTDEDNDYVINVIASDGVNTVNKNVTITVTDVDDTNPVFTSSTTASFIENETGTAYTVTATDANTVTFSLGSGNDEALFDIVGSTGVITFKAAPDFENPADTDEDNAYVINVIASDGVNTTNQNVTITVTDVDDTNPVFSSTTAVNFAENETGTAYTVTATDANTLTYSLGSDNDEALFDIVGSTGVVTFKTAPDFENPADTDKDNDYVINVIANDGVNTVNQNVTITVTDVDEVITSIPSNELQLTEIVLYPNPASHQLNIDLSNYSGSKLSVRITNVSGAQYFLQENISAQGLVVNVENYASGIYLVMLTTNNSIVTKRVIVNP